MELCLSLGDVQAPAEPFGLVSSSSSEKPRDDRVIMAASKTAGFCMSLSIGPSCDSSTSTSPREADQQLDTNDHQNDDDRSRFSAACGSKSDVPVQLDLLPHTPVAPRSSSHGFPWPTPSDQNGGGGGGGGSSENVNRVEEVAAVSSSPTNSGASSFQMDIGLYSSNYRGSGGKRSHSPEAEGDEGERQSNSRASDEDDINGINTRKKLRLSKEQSAFLEESFKEHHTLNPKQKLALAKQLNLRPRQVEVWFQNRRARTKLKQTEVDCEFLKRCCETLTEENRRLHKELQELRALKTHHHSNPFYMQSPATTLTMCPSCERIATTNTTSTTTTTNNNKTTTKAQAEADGFPRFYPFCQPQSHHSSAAS
ncbi:unnamed protein product [Prunus armeniaca]